MRILITGASSGIGAALARLFLEQDSQAKLVITARRVGELKIIQSVFPERVHIVSADIGKESGRNKILSAVSDGESLSYIVNNAATEGPVSPIKKMTLMGYRTSHAVNSEAPLFLTRDLLEGGHVNANARVLFISSGAAFTSYHGLASYSISKAALEMICKCFKLEYKEKNFEFATLLPGGVNTEIVDRLSKSSKEDFPLVDVVKKRQRNNGSPMLTPNQSAQFIKNVLLTASTSDYKSISWNINDFHPDYMLEKNFTDDICESSIIPSGNMQLDTHLMTLLLVFFIFAIFCSTSPCFFHRTNHQVRSFFSNSCKHKRSNVASQVEPKARASSPR